MRKLIALLTLLVSSFGFISIAAPAIASAASCGLYTQNIFYNGSNLEYTHTTAGCTDVDLVEFSPKLNGTGAIVVGIVNQSTGGTYHYVSSPPTLLDVLCGRWGVSIGTGYSCSWVGHVNLWGCGPVPQTLYSTSQWRIHRLATETWGPWHGTGSTNQSLNC